MPHILNYQPGGDHYRTQPIQPVEYNEANKLSHQEGDIVKRITRHNEPSGKGIQDLRKIIHSTLIVMWTQYGIDDEHIAGLYVKLADRMKEYEQD